MNKVNVYGSFTQSLLFSGSVSIPNYLIGHYSDLGLTAEEMMLIIHIIADGAGEPSPSAHFLASRMGLPQPEVEKLLAGLMERKFLAIEKHWDPATEQWQNYYSIMGLLDELAELWAISQVRRYQEDQNQNQKSAPSPQPQSQPSSQGSRSVGLLGTFEHELGRPLTEMECDYIKGWLQTSSDELIVEALRRGVSAGIRNFRYLDSILREWEKKGLHTKEEVLADDQYFQTRQEEKQKPRATRKPAPGKYDNFYL